LVSKKLPGSQIFPEEKRPKLSAAVIQGGALSPWDLRRGTGVIPVKDLHTRIKPLALASGHGLYITVKML
jgi:hypothetical protein